MVVADLSFAKPLEVNFENGQLNSFEFFISRNIFTNVNKSNWYRWRFLLNSIYLFNAYFVDF